MRAVIQRVKNASVSVKNERISEIKNGLFILLGIEVSDNKEDALWLSKKCLSLRIFQDEEQEMNLSVKDIIGEVLLVSQFTLHAKTKKGNRPSFIQSAPADIAKKLYNHTVNCFENELGRTTQTGVFGADMAIKATMDGPVTILIDTKRKE